MTAPHRSKADAPWLGAASPVWLKWPMVRFPVPLALLVVLSSCPRRDDAVDAGVTKPTRCEVDLTALGVASGLGTGASAKVVASAADLIGGQTPTGRTGDVLLQNDKVRVIIEQPGRQVGPVLYGGAVIDADLVRPAGAAGRDQFGRMSVVHALGRVVRVDKVEVLADGSAGGSAVVASTGDDVVHDLFNLKSIVQAQLGNVTFVVDPDKALPLRVTTYHVLTPGQSRVRILTAYCNDGVEAASFPLLDLYDFNGSVEVFNPGGCANGLGNGDCLIDSSTWVGAQGSGVAYGVRSFSIADLTKPVTANATLVYGGVVGSVVEGRDLKGVLSYTDPDARNRPGTFLIRPGGQKSYLRDLVIARDLAGVSAELLRIDGAAKGVIEVTTRDPAGAAAGFSRVAVVGADDKLVTVVETDAAGKGAAVVAPGSYALSATREGLQIGPVVTVDVKKDLVHAAALQLGAGRTLKVQVADPFGAPMPAKVTVRCVGGPCPFSAATWKRHLLLEAVAGGAAAVGFVPMNGRLELTLPPGQYEVLVSRGPEYSVWPDTWPAAGQRVDLTAADQQVSAVLGRIFDTPGWMSADLHVHAINSTDSLVPNERRVANFLAEGVDVLVSTDHEFITDYQPVIEALGGQGVMASIIGEEVTSFSHGHFNTFPLRRDETRGGNGGAFDHAGGEGPTLRLTELFPQIKAAFGSVIQINHPRGSGGALTQLKVDTATLASHADPATFRMAPAPDATAANTRLFGDGFDGLEAANGPGLSFEVVNDWMTFLSRGTVRTATGVSDSHKALSSSGGYSRTWLRVGVDAPAMITPALFAEAVRKNHAVISNGPYLKVTARKLSAAGVAEGPEVEVGQTLKLSAAALEGVELTVEVLAADWVQFDRIELYSHAPGRTALNGEGNSTWPEGRILDKKQLDPTALTVEAVPGMNGVALRRLRVVERFVQKPTADTWFVVMVRSVASTRSMLPLVDARPFAMSNAILVDADGSGAYDDFPLKPGQGLSRPPEVKPLGPRRVPTGAELERALRELLHEEEPAK